MSEATRTLQHLLTQLKRERQENEMQTRAVEGALQAVNGRIRSRRSQPGAQPMSAARRRAISRRMKAMWAKKHKVKA